MGRRRPCRSRSRFDVYDYGERYSDWPSRLNGGCRLRRPANRDGDRLSLVRLLEYAPYEADSITPFVANNPVMPFYAHLGQYKAHLTIRASWSRLSAWQQANGTPTGHAHPVLPTYSLVCLSQLVLCQEHPSSSDVGSQGGRDTGVSWHKKHTTSAPILTLQLERGISPSRSEVNHE
jgi:hypothetical protein